MTVQDTPFCGYLQLGEELKYEGEVPSHLGIGGGDYVRLGIDNETGKIIGWKPLKPSEIKEALGYE